MSRPDPSLEQRVADLERQVQELSVTLAGLSTELTTDKPPVKHRPGKASAKPDQGSSEEILSWLDRSAILPRVATTSFILVVALALRTAVENQLFDRQLGSFLGVLYAFGLIVFGWFAYTRQNNQAPVFTLWGNIVMSAVVVEAHRVFASVPAEMAYLTLVATGAVATMMSRMNRVALPVFAGTLGMSFGAFALDYPSPHFGYLTLVLILANGFSAYASRLLRASWLRWLLLLLTLFMIQIWDLKLAIYLSKLQPYQLDASIRGFIPAIALLGFSFAVISFLGVRGKIQDKVSKFDLVLPLITVGWFTLAGHYAARLGLVSPATFGGLGSAGGVALLGTGLWLARLQPGGALGTTTFSLAGGLLLIYCTPLAIGHALSAFALCGLLALVIAKVSTHVASPGLRLVSYLLQLVAGSALIVHLSFSEMSQPSLVGAVSSGVLATLAFCHYAWARSHPDSFGAPMFNRINKGDRLASLLLIAGLLSGFFTCRVGLYQILDLMHLAKPGYFAGAQSVMINLAGAVLLGIALLRHNIELRNVGFVVIVLGGAKVFLLDMVALKGLSLLLGVFSFGLVAALASLVLGRWNKTTSADPGAPTAPGSSR